MKGVFKTSFIMKDFKALVCIKVCFVKPLWAIILKRRLPDLDTCLHLGLGFLEAYPKHSIAASTDFVSRKESGGDCKLCCDYLLRAVKNRIMKSL